MTLAEQWAPALVAVVTVFVMSSLLQAAWWITFLTVTVVAVATGLLIARRKAARSAATMPDEHPRV